MLNNNFCKRKDPSAIVDHLFQFQYVNSAFVLLETLAFDNNMLGARIEAEKFEESAICKSTKHDTLTSAYNALKCPKVSLLKKKKHMLCYTD